MKAIQEEDERLNGVEENVFKAHSSLIRALLCTEEVQPALSQMMIEKFMETAAEIDGSYCPRNSLPAQILLQFRFLDRLVEAKIFTESLLQALSVCPLSLQKEMIMFIPEIVNDSTHVMVVNHLQEYLDTNTGLTPVILDTLGSLNLDNSVMEPIRLSVVQSLGSANMTDLPIILRFLFASTTKKEDIVTVVNGIRQKINPVSLRKVDSMTKKGKRGKQPEASRDSSPCMLLFDTLKSSLQLSKEFSSAFLSVIQASTKVEENYIIDVWILIALHAVPTTRNNALNVFKTKISKSHFNTDLVRKSIEGNSDVLFSCFRDLLCIGSAMLRSTSVVKSFGAYFFEILFKEFSSKLCRTDIIGQLMGHVGATEGEADVALDIFHTIATSFTQASRSYFSTFQGLLDCMEGMTEKQVRTMYKIYCALSFVKETSRTEMVQSDLVVIVRKQLVNPEGHYKRYGIIGATMLISNLSDKGQEICTQDNNLSISLFTSAYDSAQSTHGCTAFLYDEVTNMLTHASIHNEVVLSMFGIIESEFQQQYLQDDSPDNSSSMEDTTLWANLDSIDSPIAVNIIGIIEMSPQKDYLSRLPAAFRLLQTCCRITNENQLGSIDALLGCPLRMFPIEEIEQEAKYSTLSEEKKVSMVLAVYYALNWFRETINTYADQKDTGARAKVIRRVDNVVYLEDKLKYCLSKMNNSSFVLATLYRKGLSKEVEETPNITALQPYMRSLRETAFKVCLSCTLQEALSFYWYYQLGNNSFYPASSLQQAV